MMFYGPLLDASILGVVILLLSWVFKKKNFSLLVRAIPGSIGIIISIIMFCIGYFNVRGFEGASYLFFAFFLIIYSFISLVITKNSKVMNKNI